MTTTFTKTHRLPPSITRSTALTYLHNHAFILSADSNLTSYTSLPTSTPSPLPTEHQSKKIAETRIYTIRDKVADVPGGLWSSDVESAGEYTNLTDGIFLRGKSPLSVVTETVIRVEGAEGEGEGEGLVIRCESRVSCSRLIVGVIKGSLERNLEGLVGGVVR
ncbi:uncharacterized protein LY89DRAFT_622458, partial [Mollisia scopiformis]